MPVGEMRVVGTTLRITGGMGLPTTVTWSRTRLSEYDPVVTLNGVAVSEGVAYATSDTVIPINWQFRPSAPGEFKDNYRFTVRVN